MKPSGWKAPEPTTVSSAILFHCATVFPGGNAAAASRVLPAPAATASAVTARTTTRSTRALIIPPLDWFPLAALTLALGPLRGRCSALRTHRVVDCGESREEGAGIPGAGAGRGRPRRRGHADRLADATDAARAAPDAPERGRVDGPDRRCALARQPAGSTPEALVPCLEAAGDPPGCWHGECRGRDAGDASDRLHTSDRPRPARCIALRAPHALRAVCARG